MLNASTRKEHDSIGERSLPNNVYYGIHTLRALENFPITGVCLDHFPEFVKALAMVKLAAARANRELGALDGEREKFIVSACQDVIDGQYVKQFVVDMIQGGACTSANMNANEVIAIIANETLGARKEVTISSTQMTT